MNKILKLGTRKSALALWQSHYVDWLLKQRFPDLKTEIVGMTSSGDDLSKDISREGGKGLFIKELEAALLSKEVDFCIHSLKDFPVTPAPGALIAATPQRGEVRDVLVTKNQKTLFEFSETMKIGTSSLRRQAQLRALGLKAELKPIRGNIDTRLKKVVDGDYDGIILAGAGLIRLGLDSEISQMISPYDMIPAPGQGIIAVECREEDHEIRQILSAITHDATWKAMLVERAFLRGLGASCSLPLGAWCEVKDHELHFHGFLSDPFAKNVLIDHAVSTDDPEDFGSMMAERFMAQGGKEILKSC